MKNIFCKVAKLWAFIGNSLHKIHPLVDLFARLYISKVFFMSGLSKISDWETTIWLFEEEYAVPLLSPEIAACLATTGELVLPILLVVGLLTRFAATGLFILNLVAVLSYYSTLQSSPAALQDHLQWGILLAFIATASAKLFTLDRLLLQKTRC